jgi:hypothetical protein
MRLELTQEQASELDILIDSTLRDMSYEIAATDNCRYRAKLIDRRNQLRAVADTLQTGEAGWEKAAAPTPTESQPVWTVEVSFTEDEDKTRADARLRAAQGEWDGRGRAKRNPVDPDVPMIGEELAAARALSDLSHQLLLAAAREIESFEGQPVRLHT